jgi:TRAP transporter TAXI family solute receptor
MPKAHAITLRKTMALTAVGFWLAVGVASVSFAQMKERIVSIGTGAVTGVYYPAGGAICRLINLRRKEHFIRCYVESTGGSIYNLHAIRDHEINFGIVQSDWHYRAYNGEGIFAEGPAFTGLRSVFSLHSEMFTVAVRNESDIQSFNDLKGKTVNIGNRGSGMRAIMRDIMDIKGWSLSDFKEATELSPLESVKAFCEKKIDAMVFAAGHPNGLIQEITSRCNARLVPLNSGVINQLIELNPYYAHTAIPGGMYKQNPSNVQTFGIRATLVTTNDVSDDIVYNMVRSVFENFDDFKTLHFVFANLDKQRMVDSGLTAPLHDGARRYYEEKGWIARKQKKRRE